MTPRAFVLAAVATILFAAGAIALSWAVLEVRYVRCRSSLDDGRRSVECLVVYR